MRAPEATRAALLSHAGALFNTQGYRATSLSDITAAAGLTKGAIYAHFTDKAQLEIEAFDHLAAQVMQAFGSVIKAEPTAGQKLRALFRFFQTYVTRPVVAGGCPLQNAAVEADDAHPELRHRVRSLYAALRAGTERVLINGIRYGQLRPELDVQAMATLILASLEGAVMLGRLSGSEADVRAVTQALERILTPYEIVAEINR